MTKRKIAIALTGASGSIYAQLLLKHLSLLNPADYEIGIVISDTAKIVWEQELGEQPLPESKAFKYYKKTDFSAPFASGSAQYDTLIVCPCSMGTLGRIASGISNDLITRAADVILKERRKLILVCRETPFSLIHINNMKVATEAGGIICPAVPSFYSRPKSMEDVALTVVYRMLDLANIPHSGFRWSENA